MTKLYEIITIWITTKPGWLLIFDGEHAYLLPEKEFINVAVEVAKKFKNNATLTPYTLCHTDGLVWKTNEQQIYNYVVERLREIRKNYAMVEV